MRLAQPLAEIGNLVVLGLKLCRLSLQFGLDFCELRPQTPDFRVLSFALLCVILRRSCPLRPRSELLPLAPPAPD